MFEKLEFLVQEICSQCAVELYDLEIINTQQGKVLCVYITKKRGASITDCANVSKGLSALFEQEPEIIKGTYTLEVSSPGIERTLKLKKHYFHSIDEFLIVSYHQSDIKDPKNLLDREKTKTTITGKLVAVHSEHILLNNGSENIKIPFSSIKKAKTIYQKIAKEEN